MNSLPSPYRGLQPLVEEDEWEDWEREEEVEEVMVQLGGEQVIPHIWGVQSIAWPFLISGCKYSIVGSQNLL